MSSSLTKKKSISAPGGIDFKDIQIEMQGDSVIVNYGPDSMRFNNPAIDGLRVQIISIKDGADLTAFLPH